MPREIYADADLVVRESQVGPSPAALTFTPTETYARLSRAEIEELYERLGRWLQR
jgi:hypothetical protein